MSGLNNLKKRVSYRGGNRQVDRMIDDKVRSLSKALLYSYQSATAVLADGREFRCLINPNKINMELDDKMLSIPFEDICLNSEKPEGETTSLGKEPIGVKVGDIIGWKENGTHWIIYSQYLQEVAYFRGLMRQCESEPLDINGKKHYYYLKGPDEKSIDWQKTKHFIFNDLNYTVEIYISNTTEANEFFHRFTKCKLLIKKPNGEYDYRPYEVQAVDDITTPGLLAIYLKEDYTNEWARGQVEEDNSAPESAIDPSSARIEGPNEVYPYDIIQYSTVNIAGGKWLLSNGRAKIVEQNESSVTIEITTGKSGSVSLIYRVDGKEDIVYNISILSL